MNSALQSLSVLAPTISSAELRVYLALAAAADVDDAKTVAASSRQLAERCTLGRRHVQRAIDKLNERGLIVTSPNSTKHSAFYQLTQTESTNVREVTVATLGSHPGVKREPLVATLGSHPGVKREPLVATLGSHPDPPINKERAPAPASINFDFDFDRSIARLREAEKSDYDQNVFADARRALHSYHAKWARPSNRIETPPPDQIVAEFLAIAEWPRLVDLLNDLWAERIEAGYSWGWFTTVALQRIHGVDPKEVAAARARAATKRKPPAKSAPTLRDIDSQLRTVAASKAMR